MRSRIAVVYSLIFGYCIVVASADVDRQSEDSDQKWEGGNNREIGISLPLSDDNVPTTQTLSDILEIHGDPRYAMKIDGKVDPIREISKQLNHLITIGEQQLERLGSLEHRYTKLEEQTESIHGELREIPIKVQKLETVLNTVKADTVLLKEGLQQTHNDISSISNGSRRNNQARCQFEMETKNKLETLQVSVRDVSSSIGSVLYELSTIERDITNVANITSEFLRRNKQFPTTEYLDSKTMKLKNTTISEKIEMTRKMSDYEKKPPADCWDVLQNGHSSSDIYKIQPLGTTYPFDVYCNMETHGGGWTVFQNRHFSNDGGVDFIRRWQEYKLGFGDLHGDFWLGLQNVYQMTNHKLYEILIEVKSSNSTQFFALHDKFVIGSEVEGYPLKELGDYTGTAGDPMRSNVGKKFSTVDVDNDSWQTGSCAVSLKGGWRYNDCSGCVPNGSNIGRDPNAIENTFSWRGENGRFHLLMESRMSLRPRNRLH